MSAGRLTYSRVCEWCDEPSPTPICRKCMGYHVEPVRIETPTPKPAVERTPKQKVVRPVVEKAIAAAKDRRAARCVWPGCGSFASDCNHRRNIRKLGLTGKEFDPATLPELWKSRLYKARAKGAWRMSAQQTAVRLERLAAIRELFIDGKPHTTAEMIAVCGTSKKAMLHRYRAELGIQTVRRGVWISNGATMPEPRGVRITYADRVFAFVKESPGLMSHHVAKQVGIPPLRVREALARLAKLGEVVGRYDGHNKRWYAQN